MILCPGKTQVEENIHLLKTLLTVFVLPQYNIKLINDERDIEKSEYFQKAHKLIEDANRIFFLGFSFDKTNLERLQVERMLVYRFQNNVTVDFDI